MLERLDWIFLHPITHPRILPGVMGPLWAASMLLSRRLSSTRTPPTRALPTRCAVITLRFVLLAVVLLALIEKPFFLLCFMLRLIYADARLCGPTLSLWAVPAWRHRVHLGEPASTCATTPRVRALLLSPQIVLLSPDRTSLPISYLSPYRTSLPRSYFKESSLDPSPFISALLVKLLTRRRELHRPKAICCCNDQLHNHRCVHCCGREYHEPPHLLLHQARCGAGC
jgi:hypothetical protein